MARNLQPEHRCMKLEDWPEADRAAWERARQPADPFEPHIGYANRWRAITQAMIEQGYGRWLTWLDLNGHLDRGQSPSERVTEERLRAYFGALRQQGLSDYSVAARLQQLGNALKAMAPDKDWTRILRASDRVHAGAVPVTNIEAKLQPAEAVLQLGLDLMEAAEKDRFRTPTDRATLFRDGLVIAFLIHRPVRLGNLTSITIGTHLHRRGEDWWVAFQGAETKGGRPIEFIWPAELAEALERYMTVHRPVLMGAGKSDAPSNALWVARGGKPMGDDAIAFQVNARTEEEFGKAINPHTFRHIAATTIATDDPEHAANTASVLSHASLKTTERYYNKAKQQDAAERVHEVHKALKRNRGRFNSEGQCEIAM